MCFAFIPTKRVSCTNIPTSWKFAFVHFWEHLVKRQEKLNLPVYATHSSFTRITVSFLSHGLACRPRSQRRFQILALIMYDEKLLG